MARCAVWPATRVSLSIRLSGQRRRNPSRRPTTARDGSCRSGNSETPPAISPGTSPGGRLSLATHQPEAAMNSAATRELIEVAQGQRPADLVLQGGKVV